MNTTIKTQNRMKMNPKSQLAIRAALPQGHVLPGAVLRNATDANLAYWHRKGYIDRAGGFFVLSLYGYGLI